MFSISKWFNQVKNCAHYSAASDAVCVYLSKVEIFDFYNLWPLSTWFHRITDQTVYQLWQTVLWPFIVVVLFRSWQNILLLKSQQQKKNEKMLSISPRTLSLSQSLCIVCWFISLSVRKSKCSLSRPAAKMNPSIYFSAISPDRLLFVDWKFS